MDDLWKRYPKGLVANVSKGNVHEGGGGLARYLAKYVASPPIAVSRIINYDGRNVTYWYNDHKTKAKKAETVSVDVFLGRMVQHIMPKGFQRVRYYGLQATKTFKKWAVIISNGVKATGRAIKGTYKILKVKKYRERYIEISSKDPFLCRYCGNEMVLWLIWHPKYGNLFDEYENIKAGKYTPFIIDEGETGDKGGGCPIRPSTGNVQLSLFAM